ncbi:hypothetical protein PV04_08525 [Phialophora macrospora]|uniref:BTB domain-containing protein n=1 Tax=Phialophora macrospora TaxID=1851006 RepID=A0A0D2CEN6_9EURO|nr:hypothetical protein PV04_08525 [Phialophora macrospora]
MDPRHRRLYVRWCQSPRVELVVGDETISNEGSFLFPQELLRRRSRTLQERIELHNGKAISLSDTAVPTLTEFFIWSNRPDPHLEDRLNFTEVVDLGIFAWKYQISALSNQVTDKVRANLASGEWELQATIVNDIYQATEPDSPLRGVVRAALGQLSRTVIAGEEWEKTFRNNRDLGWDYLRAGDKEWVRQDYLSGVCRFHNHDGIKRQEGLCDGCPFAEADCYPDWEENIKQEQEFEKSEHEKPSPPDDATEVVAEAAAVEEPEPSATEPEPTVGESEPDTVPEPAFEEAAAEEVAYVAETVEDTTHEEAVVEESPLEPQEPEKFNGVDGLNMNGHVKSEDAEEAHEEADGSETPHVNGARAASVADSVYPESLSSDRENIAPIPAVNGNRAENNSVKATGTAVLEAGRGKLSKNQKRKMAKRLSMSVARGTDRSEGLGEKNPGSLGVASGS